MSRPLVLDHKPLEARHGFTDGEWVHTIEPMVVAWFGPGRAKVWRRGAQTEEEVDVTTNRQHFEGEVMITFGRLAVLTTQRDKPHRYSTDKRLGDRILVYQNILPSNLRRGRRNNGRALVLEASDDLR